MLVSDFLVSISHKVEISTTSGNNTIVILRGASLQILPGIIHSTNNKEDGYKYDSVKLYNEPIIVDAHYICRSGRRTRSTRRFTVDYNGICKQTIFEKNVTETREDKIRSVRFEKIEEIGVHSTDARQISLRRRAKRG